MKKHLLLFLFALIAFVPTWAEGVASAELAVNDDDYPPSGNLRLEVLSSPMLQEYICIV